LLLKIIPLTAIDSLLVEVIEEFYPEQETVSGLTLTSGDNTKASTSSELKEKLVNQAG
jgi:hypothetical protein